MSEPDVDDLTLERRAFDSTSDGFSLLRAVSLLPRIAGRMPEVGRVTATVDGWAESVVERMNSMNPVKALTEVLFVDGGLSGDDLDYDNPDNSFLDSVVARKRGLPIALSVLTTEVCARAGIKAWGLALPAHFCVAVFTDVAQGHFIVIDPFNGGAMVSPERVAERAGVPESELGEVLQPATAEQTLTRMLVNLTVSYNRRGLHQPLARTLDRLLLLRPNDPRALIERAAVRRFLLDDEGSLADVDAAERAAPDDERIARAAAAVRADIERSQVLN